MRTHARPVVDEFRNELGPTRCLLVPHHPVPIDYRGPVGVRVIVPEVRHEALAHDEVLDPVSIDIGKSSSMRLRKQDIARIFRVVIVHENMPHEANFTRRAALLLEPRESPAVRFQARHHVVQAIAIYVVNAHFRATRVALRFAPAPERDRMMLPQSLRASPRLLPPAKRADNIQPAVPIYISHSEPVRTVRRPRSRFGNWGQFPGL